MKMIQNLNHLLGPAEIAKLTRELDRNSVALFKLGEAHFAFAARLQNAEWRQKISRAYYGVYNVRRAVVLKHSGSFSTDSSDHKNVDQLPDRIPNREAYIDGLRNLREDRNLADYSHLAVVGDLVMAPDQAVDFATRFIGDCRGYLTQEGLTL